MKHRLIATCLAGLLAAGTFAAPTSPAVATPVHAPVDRAGPALRPSHAALDAAVTCSGNFRNGKEPVLLVPGTWFTYKTQYAWSWAPALTRAGIPWCSVTPPENSLGDLTIAGEYDVYAIRKTYQLAGKRKIAIVGHSQGGMRPRWALRFWPDTRAMVADYVAVAPDNHGAKNMSLISPGCNLLPGSPLSCPQGIWQQLPNSQFIAAVNSIQETFAGIDYTVIYSNLDGLVLPTDTPLSAVPGAGYRRAAIQEVCPIRVADHLTNGSVDAVAWAMLFDAITQPGPLDPARISRSVCAQLLLPGLEPVAATQATVGAVVQIASAQASASKQTSENPLPCYVYEAGCPVEAQHAPAPSPPLETVDEPQPAANPATDTPATSATPAPSTSGTTPAPLLSELGLKGLLAPR